VDKRNNVMSIEKQQSANIKLDLPLTSKVRHQ